MFFFIKPNVSEQEDQRDWDRDGPGQELHRLPQAQHGHHHQENLGRPLGSKRHGGEQQSWRLINWMVYNGEKHQPTPIEED